MMRVRCSDFVAELGRYLEDGLATDLREALDEHLAACSTCHVVLDSSRKTMRIVTESGEYELAQRLPEGVTAGIMSRIRDRTRTDG